MMDIRLLDMIINTISFMSKIKSIKFYKNGNKKKEVYYNGTILEYDEKGNIIYYKDSDGNEIWREYDTLRNIMYQKDSNGNAKCVRRIRTTVKHDIEAILYSLLLSKQIKSIKFYKNGKVKQEVYRDGTIYEYDERGNNIHYKDSHGYEYWREYDERDNIVHYKDSDEDEWWREYDENGRLINYNQSGN